MGLKREGDESFILKPLDFLAKVIQKITNTGTEILQYSIYESTSGENAPKRSRQIRADHELLQVDHNPIGMKIICFPDEKVRTRNRVEHQVNTV